MRNVKKRAAAMGMAAMMMIPNPAYGQSVDLTKMDLCTYREQLILLLENCGNGILEELFPDFGSKPDQEIQPDNGNNGIEEDNGGNNAGDTIGDSQNVSKVAAEMLKKVNEERRSAGLSDLKLSTKVSNVAQVKAEDMRDNGYFSHTSPTYGSPFDMLKKFGISYKKAGENIAKGQRSVSEVMNGWMNSSGHRANILNGDYTHLGVGYCTDNSGNGYWVQMFIAE